MVHMKIKADAFAAEHIPHFGNKFLTGNGYLGIRGTMEEFTKEHMPAVNMAGIYDKVGDGWRESVNAPNPLYTYVVIDGKKLALPDDTPSRHIQELDIDAAIHTRNTVWETEKGEVSVFCERFASMANRHAACMKYTLKTDFDCKAEIVTGIDGDVWDIHGPHFARVEASTTATLEKVSGITGEKGTVVSCEECVKFDFDASMKTHAAEKSVLKVISFTAKAGEEYTFEKVAQIMTSCDQIPCKEPTDALSYEVLRAEHIAAWSKIWDISRVEIEGDDDAMLALNYSIYHLNCIAPRDMSGVSIPARGLSGQVYKGAVFWDTEMFMIDYYIHTDPAVAKTLIEYRINTIGGARDKAKEYGLAGAYYAWESQEGGFEACSDYNIVDVFTKRPMRTYFRDKQYHVSAAVVYAIMKYIDATGDTSILSDGAMKVILECAMMYRSLLLKKADGRCYEIHDVVGPDEYHERVNNNAYTNKMAQFVFKTACNMIDKLDNDSYNALNKDYDLEKLGAIFKDSYENIYIPAPNAENGLIEQFDGYFGLEDATVDEVRSRLLDPKEYWGGAYGVASDTQVLKQADVVAMLSMFKNDYTTEVMRKNWEYYEPRTEHGSSLSACMYSLLSCYTGAPDDAYPLFMKSAAADMNPGGKEWIGLIYIGGTHPASEGGAWIVAMRGFAGVDISDGTLRCTPRLPSKWKKMSFKLIFKGELYSISICGNDAKIEKI